MDDVLKSAGAITGMGFAVVLGLVGWRIYQDQALTWFVVGGGMLCLVLTLGGLFARQMRATWEARAAVLRLQNESSLIGARAIRTLDGIQARPAGGDFLGQLIAGASGGDVFDTQPGLTWGPDDHVGAPGE